MKQIIKSFKEEFTTVAVVTIPLCVAVNYISGTIAGMPVSYTHLTLPTNSRV